MCSSSFSLHKSPIWRVLRLRAATASLKQTAASRPTTQGHADLDFSLGHVNQVGLRRGVSSHVSAAAPILILLVVVPEDSPCTAIDERRFPLSSGHRSTPAVARPLFSLQREVRRLSRRVSQLCVLFSYPRPSSSHCSNMGSADVSFLWYYFFCAN
ncbi:unnamed protein product [Prorocentrum cordatum]|uniref:Uncharacterized protein n=1 Tax=Prorocentrum cordatum TaxID=2364126 RepID=A0ABN9S1C2_9DINO|nr:unnamed protein product [Polarella glacialis]